MLFYILLTYLVLTVRTDADDSCVGVSYYDNVLGIQRNMLWRPLANAT